MGSNHSSNGVGRGGQHDSTLSSSSFLEKILASDLTRNGIKFTREHQFHSVRKWRFDFALIPIKVGIEVEGGTMNGGRHVKPYGYEKDCEKYNAATMEGWRLLRYTGRQVKNGSAIKQILELVKQEETRGC